jgi:glycosyltransferase involved in cell wall biosynthesis
MADAPTHLVLIPSYNTGAQLLVTVRDALTAWPDVWVVIDGSTDGSERDLPALQATYPQLRVIRRERNGGKGCAVLTGVTAAQEAGFTHALVMDADGQHPVDHVQRFMACSAAHPEAVVLGQPQFGPEAPLERLYGRKVSIGLTHLETLGVEIADPLFGFRVYPIAALRAALASTHSARGYDFDPEVAVRLFWAGVPVINLPAPCRYLSRAEGGVSHYHYLRDNVKMVRLHLRLLGELAGGRWRSVRRLRRARQRSSPSEVPPTTT